MRMAYVAAEVYAEDKHVRDHGLKRRAQQIPFEVHAPCEACRTIGWRASPVNGEQAVQTWLEEESSEY